MAGLPLSDAQCKEALGALKNAGGNQIKAALIIGVSVGTFRFRMREAKRRFPALFTPPESGGRPTTKRTLNDEIETLNRDADRHSDREKLREAIREITALRERIAKLEWSHNVSLKPANWTFDTRAPKGKSIHIPLLFFSDAQAGEVVRSEETDAPWDYNSDIFRQRYRRMISTAIELAIGHGGSRWTYPGIVYCRGGDNISGGLHEDLRELGEDAVASEQCEMVAEEESSGIAKLAEAFGKVEVRTAGGSGNHDRITAKPPTKLAWARSYDRFVHKMLTMEFRDDKRVTFQTSKSPDIRFPVFEKRLFMSHGDKMGSSGGMGFVGPGATILRGWQKLRMEQAQLGYHVDMILTGHLHYPITTLWGIGNGSFTGTTEYGKRFRMEPQPPMQYLTFFNPKHGRVDVREIYLAEGSA
jgi:hypothetical protein